MRSLLLLLLLASPLAHAQDEEGEIMGRIQEGKSALDRVRPGEPYPDLTFDGGRPHNLSEVEGVRVLHFWASWCGPCIESLPALGDVAEIWRDRGVTFLAVSVDPAGAERRFAKRSFRRAHAGGALQLVYASEDTRDLFAKLVDVDAWRVRVPATAVIDGEGRLYEAWRTQTTVEEGPLQAVLERLVGDALVSE